MQDRQGVVWRYSKDTAVPIGPECGYAIKVMVVSDDQTTRIVPNRGTKRNQRDNHAMQACPKHRSAERRAVETSIRRRNQATRRIVRLKIMEHLNRIVFLCLSRSQAADDC